MEGKEKKTTIGGGRKQLKRVLMHIVRLPYFEIAKKKWILAARCIVVYVQSRLVNFK